MVNTPTPKTNHHLNQQFLHVVSDEAPAGLYNQTQDASSGRGETAKLRIPAGFYVAVHHSGLEWRTANKRVSVSNDAVQWDGPIPIPCNPIAIVEIFLRASFELQPALGRGEQLRKLTVKVKELLHRSTNGQAFTFFPRFEHMVSPCSSISVIINERNWQGGESIMFMVIDPHRSTAGPRNELEDVTDLGHSALSHYREHGDKQDLEFSIKQFERAERLCPLGHPCRSAALSNVAMAKFVQSQVDDAHDSLHIPLALYRNALSARPAGHPDRPYTLIQLATIHLAAQRSQDDVDPTQMIHALLEEARSLSFEGSHEERASVFMLQLRAGCEARAHRERGQSLSGLSNEHPVNFCAALVHHFEQSGALESLQQAISTLQGFISSTSIWGTGYLVALANLGVALWHRYRSLGELGDLQEAISILKDAVDLTPDSHPDKPGRLNNLGTAFTARFSRLGELNDLQEAIVRLGDAVGLTPDSHYEKPGYISNLGSTFYARFQRLGELDDLEQAISRQRDAANLAPDSHPHKPGFLNNLGTILGARFSRLGQLDDLEQAISRLRNAVDLTPDSHPEKPGFLSNLGNTFRARFQCLGQLSDLEQAVSRLSEAVDLTPNSRPEKPGRLNNLGTAFRVRFGRLGEVSDLEQAISRLREAVDLAPNFHPDKPSHLTNLGTSFRARFERLGELDDLEQAISRLRDAVDLSPDSHTEKPGCLNNLGIIFQARFERLGELDDLEHAILRLRNAVDLTPDFHPDKPRRLTNLGIAFRQRFQRLGELDDLEQAISTLKVAVDLTPDSHTERLGRLSDLGITFLVRFERLGELDDLEQAISRLRVAVNLTPGSHPGKPGYLSSLGGIFLARFQRLDELDDLEQAISRLRESVDLTHDSHPKKPGRLNDLSSTFLVRFRRLGELDDLEQAILRQREAIDFTPDSHPEKPSRLSNLGTMFGLRFLHLHEPSDMKQAILKLKSAVDLTPDAHPGKPRRLINLGDTFVIYFQSFRQDWYLQEAASYYSTAALTSTGLSSHRFLAAEKWIDCAHALSYPSVLDAYSTAVDLLPKLTWTGVSLVQRYQDLSKGTGVVREAAAAAALDAGHLQIAVEWLEHGRSVVWGELFQLRDPCAELSAVYPDHAHRLRQVSSLFETAGASRERSSSLLLEDAGGTDHTGTMASLEEEARRHRALAIKRDKLLEEIRALPGFGRFLLRKQFAELQESVRSASGPVVILNAAKNRCDALILLAELNDVIHVPLPGFTSERSERLQTFMHGILSREGKRRRRNPADAWIRILATLWNYVVKPVLDALAFSSLGTLKRMFWCPTGSFTFLPIHAAGLYDEEHSEPGHKLSDFVISSYVPSIGTLARSPEIDTPCREELRFLTVRQPSSDGQDHLPGVAAEMRCIEEVVTRSQASIHIKEPARGTVEEVLELMKEADWVHFACHGTQNFQNPASSGLCLADRRCLKISDMISLSRPRGGLAFLSACETAMGDERLSEEAIHIAAGMLFAGYGSVIATMWSISDRTAPCVAEAVYQRLLLSGARPDPRDAARALQSAVGDIRASGASFEEWLPFIHVGL